MSFSTRRLGSTSATTTSACEAAKCRCKALPYDLNRSAAIPITGGAGVYEGAYGHLTLLKNSTPPVRYQLHIITP